jgi:Ran GTPase-activating protein (RanGAP) involved in mRNA processing and transport
MTPKSRLFYDMEGQWVERGGEYLDLSDVLVDEIMMAGGVGGVGGVGALGGVYDEDVEDEDDEYEEEEEEEQTMRERLDVEKEIDPFWS